MNATPGDVLKGIPLVVIINEGSASASEIFAGALKDHNRAIVVGRKSFGKGSVQTILPVSDNTAVKLTTALYYTPFGHVIQGNGVIPDITVPYKEIASKNDDDPTKVQRLISESNFANSIKADKQSSEQSKSVIKQDLFKKYASSDFPLYQSIVILKGLHANAS